MKAQIENTTPTTLLTPQYHIKIIKNTYKEETTEIEEIQTNKNTYMIYKEKYNHLFRFKDKTHNLFIYKTVPRGHIDYELDKINIPENIGYYVFRIDLEAPCECGCPMNIKDESHGEILCPTCGLVHQQQCCTY
jgi:hypothetical protein